MSAKYLLPCRCGHPIIVEPRQAGEIATCSCGASLQVPTMREIVALELAPDESQASPAGTAWGWCHRMLLLGAILMAAAIVAGVWLYLKHPIAPIDTIDADKIRQTASDLSPVQTWHYWGLMKQGLDRRIDQQYAAALVRFHVWLTATGVLILAGIAMIGAGIAMGKRQGTTLKTHP